MTSAFNPQPVFLSLKDVHSYYGESHILHGIDIEVHKGSA